MANYICTSSEITSLADAIRTKGGTSASLTWPNGFISAINAISGDGDTDVEDGIIMRTISGTYTNSRISHVGTAAFQSCSRLVGVSLQACKLIDSYAFQNCTSLTQIYAPSCSIIHGSAFMSCTALEQIDFPLVSILRSSAFMNCTALRSVSLPELQYISNSVFASCVNLSSIKLPKLRHSTAQYFGAFSGCTALTDFDAPLLSIVESYMFTKCGFSQISWSQITGVIREYAFASCTNLTRVEFQNCTGIYASAFYSCNRLSWVSFKTASSINTTAMKFLSTIQYAFFPALRSAPGSYFYGMYALNTIVLSECSLIGSQCFRTCYNLLSLYLLSTGIVTLSNSVFLSTPIGGYTTSTGGVYGSIYVRASLLNSYKTATNWSAYSTRMVGLADAEVEAIIAS